MKNKIKKLIGESLEDIFLNVQKGESAEDNINKEENLEEQQPVITPTKTPTQAPSAPGHPLKIPTKWPEHLPLPQPKAQTPGEYGQPQTQKAPQQQPTQQPQIATQPQVAPTQTPTKPQAPGHPLRVPTKWPEHLPLPQPKAKKTSTFSLNENFIDGFKKVIKLSEELNRMKRLINEAPPMQIGDEEEEQPHPEVKRGIEGLKPTAFSDIEYFKGGEPDYTTLEKIGTEEFKKIIADLREFGKMPTKEIGQAFGLMVRLEQPHARELEQLALNKVQAQFGLPEEIMEKLEAKLIGKQHIPNPDEDDDDMEEEVMDDIFTDEEQAIIKKHVDKRKIQNALMMGAGFRAHSIFNDIKNDLDRIDPKLYPLYSQVMPNVALFMWQFPLEDMMGGVTMMGKSEIKEKPNGEIKAEAQATIFPILLHEVAKAAIELLFAQYLIDLGEKHGEKVYKAVLKKSDVFHEEIWMKRIGPTLWKYLHDAIDYIVKHERNNDYTIVAYLLNRISLMEPEDFIELMKKVIYTGDEAIAQLNAMIDEIEENITDYEEEKGKTPKPQELETGISTDLGDVEGELDSLIKGAQQKKAVVPKVPEKSLEEMNIDELNIALEKAIDAEKYELAANIRDEINRKM